MQVEGWREQSVGCGVKDEGVGVGSRVKGVG